MDGFKYLMGSFTSSKCCKNNPFAF